MFKNTLFLKIILVFTLPALGMMYFSTVLVYDKVKSLSEIKHIEKNIKYITIVEKLLHSLQKERGFTVSYTSSKQFKLELQNQRALTNASYNNFLKFTQNIGKNNTLEADVKDIQQMIHNLNFTRINIDNEKISTNDILKKYNFINAFLLETLGNIKHIEYASTFNMKFSSILNLLIAKEHAGIERAITSVAISKHKVNKSNINSLLKSYIIQNHNLEKYLSKASIEEINYFNQKLPLNRTSQIREIREEIKRLNIPKSLTIKEWWDLSTSRIDSFQKIYSFSAIKMQLLSQRIKNEAGINQFLSLAFLFVSFATLISLLFVLKNLIFNEQKSFNKLNKQQEVYKLLNAVNMFLLTMDKEEKLYKEICKLISLNSNMSFGFVNKVSKTGTKIIAQEGELKNILDVKLQKNGNNLVTKAINRGHNIIVESFEHNNESIMSDVAQKFNLKSAASFPIRRFDTIVAVLVLYSNESNFFDNEVEILFNNMINDMSHTLEKMTYEKRRIEQEQELKIASYAFESNEPMIITDNEAHIIKANQAFCHKMGYSKDEIIGKNPRMFRSKQHEKEFYEQLWQDIANHGSWSGEIYNTTKDKELIPLRSTITAIKNSNGIISHYLAQYIDISEQIDKNKILEYQATHDNLTGLPNRLLLLDRIERAVIKVERHNMVGGVIFIDLDNFKEVNDTLGHEIGDKLLIMVAKKINETIRKEDTIARIGGDEFIVLAEHIGNSKEEAKQNMSHLAKKIKFALNSIIEIDGHKNISTPSIGVTLFCDSSICIQDIIKQADTAMYQAKRQGKNAIAFFD